MSRIVYASNRRPIGDGIRITRVSDGGQTLEVLTDHVAEKWSEVVLVSEAPAEPEPEPQPEPTPQPEPEPQPNPTPDPDPVPVPPITGSFDAFGPAELVAALAKAKGGEVIVAKAGHAYDGLNLSNINPAAPVTVRGEDGARFGPVVFGNTGNLTLSVQFGLAAQPVLGKAIPYFVRALSSTRNIVLDGCRFMSRADADQCAGWDLATWQAWKMGGCSLEGQGSAVRDCAGFGLNMGFNVSGQGSVIERCRVHGVSGDAYRLLGNGCVADDNYAQDMVYLNDGNHPDMLQMFTHSGDGQMNGMRVRRNTFRNAVDLPLSSPLLAVAQGIGTYGSPKAGGGSIQTVLTDAVVEDNIVEASSWHGLSLCIAAGGSVCRNIVRDIHGRTDGHAWLRITGACVNTQVRDNRAPKLVIEAAAAQSGNVVA